MTVGILTYPGSAKPVGDFRYIMILLQGIGGIKQKILIKLPDGGDFNGGIRYINRHRQSKCGRNPITENGLSVRKLNATDFRVRAGSSSIHPKDIIAEAVPKNSQGNGFRRAVRVLYISINAIKGVDMVYQIIDIMGGGALYHAKFR